jgi:peptide deformylase
MAAPFVIRTFGDPVLKRVCSDFEHLDDTTLKLAADMMTTMYDSHGVGLAANQVGMSKRIFTYDSRQGEKGVIVNPRIVESSGEREAEEGCLSVPGMYFTTVRAQNVTVQGLDIDGNELIIEASDYFAQIMQHETDHLDGMLYLDRLTPELRKQAMRKLREQQLKAN